jgi:hypothetical protein
MTDYLPLISRAVEGLDKSTGEARRALYERARNALVTQLRAVEPALSESEITKERLALEDAIRKVEADAARKARTELRETRPPAPAPPPRREQPSPDLERSEPRRSAQKPPPPAHDHAAGTEAPARPAPSARERLLTARGPSLREEGIKGFRNVVNEVHDLGGATAKSAQSAREARDSYEAASQHFAPTDPAESSLEALEPEPDAEDFVAEYDDARPTRGHDVHRPGDGQAGPLPARYALDAAEEGHQRPPRSYRGLIRIAVALIILAGLVATISWQWPHISAALHNVAQLGSKQPAPPAHEAPAQPKFSGRVPQEQGATQPSTAAAPNSQAAPPPAVAQRVVLYEEDPNDPNGKRFVGSALWRTQTVSPGAGQAPELAVHADVTIPERHMTMSFSLRRNTDQALPASHTIEIQFTLPADFPEGGVANVPGVLMKQSEQARGTPLAGLAVKVTNGFFLIGLSAVATDVQRNIDLLKDRPWFDIPIVYANGGRAILAMEKGPPGERAFADAFAAWDKK